MVNFMFREFSMNLTVLGPSLGLALGEILAPRGGKMAKFLEDSPNIKLILKSHG